MVGQALAQVTAFSADTPIEKINEGLEDLVKSSNKMSAMLGAVSLCNLVPVGEVAAWSKSVMTQTYDLIRADSKSTLLQSLSAAQVESLLELPLISLRQLARHSTAREDGDNLATPAKKPMDSVSALLISLHAQYTSNFLQLVK